MRCIGVKFRRLKQLQLHLIALFRAFASMEATSTTSAVLEKKGNLEEELRRVERQIYELEGEYLQARVHQPQLPYCALACVLIDVCRENAISSCAQETVKDGNILRGWEGYMGQQASSGAIRRINRFREADRMFSASSLTSGQASTFAAGGAAGTKGPAAAAASGGGGAKVKKNSAAGGATGGRKRGREADE